MPTEDLFWRRAVVLASALIYWAGVWVQACRVRRHIGKSPNLRPRGTKEKLLWLGWLVVIVSWSGQPFLAGSDSALPGLRIFAPLLHPLGFAFGLVLTLAGYAGTLWCYATMGDTWRIGINRNEKNALVTCGPYRWVRHPIYSFQIVMLGGVLLLLPTGLSLLMLGLHALCVRVKAADEEAYLAAVHGQSYRDYVARTGRLVPRLFGRRTRAE